MKSSSASVVPLRRAISYSSATANSGFRAGGIVRSGRTAGGSPALALLDIRISPPGRIRLGTGSDSVNRIARNIRKHRTFLTFSLFFTVPSAPIKLRLTKCCYQACTHTVKIKPYVYCVGLKFQRHRESISLAGIREIGLGHLCRR